MNTDNTDAERGKALAEINAQIEVDNVALRARFFVEVPCYSENEVLTKFGRELAGSDRVIFVEGNEGRHYPRFQFDETGMLPNVAAARLTLPTDMSRWQIAFWFVASNPWLDGKAPCDVLANREQLIFAAEQASGLVG
jgi:hypothetical protein